jgi:hypothetical protein
MYAFGRSNFMIYINVRDAGGLMLEARGWMLSLGYERSLGFEIKNTFYRREQEKYKSLRRVMLNA